MAGGGTRRFHLSTSIENILNLELLICGSTLLCVVTVLCYSVYRDSIVYFDALDVDDFADGWLLFGKKKDITDVEWYFFMTLMKELIPWFIVYIIISTALNRWEWSKRKYLLTGYFLACHIFMCGWKHMLIVIAHIGLCYISTKTRSMVCVWIVCLSLLSTLNFDPFITLMKTFLQSDDNRTYLLMLTLAWCNMRCLSFGLCRVKTPQHQPWPDCVDLIFYALYLPLFYNGPFMVYDIFRKQVSRTKENLSRSQICAIVVQLCRVVFWFCINNSILHVMYFGSMQYNTSLLKLLSPWTLSGIVYCQGQFFYMKYLVIFGSFSLVAKMDRMEPPRGPLCVSHIYCYSDMWKFFDTGLYSFLKTHIYIPLGGSQHGILRQFLASGVCFLFIFYWHGANFYLFLWTLLNFISVTLEGLGSYINTASRFQIKVQEYSPSLVNRIYSLCAIPVFLISVLSLFFFLGDSDGGYIMFSRIFLEGGIKVYSVLLFCTYCYIYTVKQLVEQ